MSGHYDSLRGVEVGCAAPRCCIGCPWRLDLQADPPQDDPNQPAYFYTKPMRRALVEGGNSPFAPHVLPYQRGIREGSDTVCHRTEPLNGATGKPLFCTGSVALRQRCVLRWCFGGRKEPLTTNGAWLTIAEMVGVEPLAIDIEAGWIVDGAKITPTRLVELAHPAAFDPNIATEGIPPPTDDEIARWCGAKVEPA